MQKLQSLSRQIWKEFTSLCDVRELFDICIEEFPELVVCRSEEADLVTNMTFEAALIYIQDNKHDFMSLVHREAVSSLKDGSLHEDRAVKDDSMLILGGRAMKSRKNNQGGVPRLYKDARFIVPTSNMVDYLFSSSGFALTDRRRSLLPDKFEARSFYSPIPVSGLCLKWAGLFGTWILHAVLVLFQLEYEK